MSNNVVILFCVLAQICSSWLFKMDSSYNADGISSDECQISLQHDLGEPQPLLIKPFDKPEQLYLPDTERGEIIFQKGQYVYLACPGDDNYLSIKGADQEKYIAAKCIGQDTFSVNDQQIFFHDITCQNRIKSSTRKTGFECYNGNTEIEIGFEVDESFIRNILLCHDETIHSTYYTVFNLASVTDGHQPGYPRSNFQEDFFDFNVTGLYKKENQIETFELILGSRNLAEKYIRDGAFFIARGHLVAKADFLFGSQQQSTFYYVNTAPQWQVFNAGNWNRLERSTRHFASTQKLDLVIYTGTYGVSVLPDENNNLVELYLHVDENNNKILPVPQLFWKVLYEPTKKLGIALVGVNNPYVFDDERDVICENVCSQIKWLKWKPNNVTLGYSYCCEVNEFRKTVKFLPEFDVYDLLV